MTHRTKPPRMTAHSMAIFLTAGKLDMNPALVVGALLGILDNQDARRLYQEYRNIIREFTSEKGIDL